MFEFEKIQSEKLRNKVVESTHQPPHENLLLLDLPGEEWKPFPIARYDECYEVSNLGRLKSIRRECWTHNGGVFIREARIIKQWMRIRKNKNTGEEVKYLSANITMQGRGKAFPISRLVYNTFIAHLNWKETKQYVRHKDNNSLNNTPENLYLSSKSDLINDVIRTGRRKRRVGRTDRSLWTDKEWDAGFNTSRLKVSQFDLQGNYIQTYKSLSEAAKAVGIKRTPSISAAIKGRTQTAGGYQWRLGSGKTPMKPKVLKAYQKEPFRAKKVAKYDLDGTLLEEYHSVLIAAQKNDIKLSRLYSWLTRHPVTPKGGRKFFWKYIQSEKETKYKSDNAI